MDLRTKDIKISNENPFEHDLLKRDKYVNNLTQIVKNTKGGFTLSINADWGYGKTTFVKMWEASLQNEGYKTIYFNAWETDFVADPMMALIDGLRDGFESADLPQEKLQKLSALWDVIIRIAKEIPVGNVGLIGKIAYAFKRGIDSLLKNKNQLQEQQSFKKLVVDFREQLASVAKEISSDKQLIIFVDELDRCRPDYAVQMLERIKHFFEIENIIFVISVDKTVLYKSIKAYYGGIEVDTEAYLRRFIDLEFDLPEFDISDFIDAQFERKELAIYFTNYQDHIQKHYGGEDREVTLRVALSDCLKAENRSLRDIEKYFNRLGVIISSKDLTHQVLDLTCYVLYLHMFHRDIYNHLRIVDLEVPKMWDTIKTQIASITYDSGSESYRRYMGMVIGSLAAYIDLVDRRNYYRQEILERDPKMEWFPAAYLEWLKSEISNRKGEVLKHLFSHIELLQETFNWEKAE